MLKELDEFYPGSSKPPFGLVIKYMNYITKSAILESVMSLQTGGDGNNLW